ncbi:NAD-dependent epimerase/dehydratase family protein [bacterium]|nr:NAD-dependent epimerase/dehydratase family protein [bacterium]
MLSRDASIWVTGHRGLAGSAIVRCLQAAGFSRILTIPRSELDLRDQHAVSHWMRQAQPRYIVHAAGTVGGILANSERPVDFLYDNLMIHATVLRAAQEQGVEKLLYLGSSCVYPRECPQPIREEYLLTGPLEPTNAAYAIAKIAGLVSCQAYRRQYGCNFISVMPTNLYGPYDHFDLQKAHVLPALIRKFHDARLQSRSSVPIWGTGMPRREFLHVEDFAAACLFLLDHYNDEQTINVGTGEDLTIRELAEMIADIIVPGIELEFDPAKPDGTPQKLLDVSRIRALGWSPTWPLKDGIRQTYEWYVQHLATGQLRC